MSATLDAPEVPLSSLTLADAAISADPFAPQGVSFQPVSVNLIGVRVAGCLIVNVILALVCGALAFVWGRWWLVGVACAAALTAWELWLVPRQVRAMGYALGEEHLLWRTGIMFRKISVIPYGRMQFVDTSQGPIARRLGIAEVKLHTASASTDATINGLPVAEAERLRQILSERGEERMSGL